MTFGELPCRATETISRSPSRTHLYLHREKVIFHERQSFVPESKLRADGIRTAALNKAIERSLMRVSLPRAFRLPIKLRRAIFLFLPPPSVFLIDIVFYSSVCVSQSLIGLSAATEISSRQTIYEKLRKDRPRIPVAGNAARLR